MPLPLGEAGRRPGEGASRRVTVDESTLTPALSRREREEDMGPFGREIKTAYGSLQSVVMDCISKEFQCAP